MNYKFVLVDSESGYNRTQWILRPPVTVGRCPTADITISNDSISRRHCQFTLDSEGALVVRDLGSTNGIYIDEQRVHKATVRPGTDVQIGAITLRPEWTDEESTPSLESAPVIELDATQPMKIISLDDQPESAEGDAGH